MILITGGHGFLGCSLANSFSRDNIDVLAPGRESLDVLDIRAVERFLAENSVEVVIHTAARGGRRTRPDEYSDFYQNVAMFENLAANRDKYKLMINLGSGAEFDRTVEINSAKEEDIAKRVPTDFYGLSKNVIAKRINGIGDNIVNLRIFNCFGEKELSDRMIKANCIRHLQGQEMVVYTNKEMDFFYVEDLYKVIRHYINNFGANLPLDVNLCYEEKLHLIEIAELIMTLTGRPNSVKLVDEVNGRSYTGDPTKLASLDIGMSGIESGILQVYKFLQSIYEENKK